MGKVITFINEKGGIGKTSCCFNISWEMSKTEKILLIDLDGQRANLSYFLGIEKKENTPTMFDVLQAGANIKDTIINVKYNIDAVPATVNVANLNPTAKISRMKKAIEEIRNNYDYIFIDVNPTPNWSHVLALSCSDYIIIPMLPHITSLEANNGITESVEEIQESSNPNLKVLGILFNENENRTRLSKSVSAIAEKMAVQLNSKVFKNKIRKAVALSENVSMHVGVTEYDPKAPVSKDIKAVVEEIRQEVRNNG